MRSEVTEPYVEIYRQLLQRASERKEIPSRFITSGPVLAEVIPAMCSHRLELERGPVQRGFYVSVIDAVLLANLRAPEA